MLYGHVKASFHAKALSSQSPVDGRRNRLPHHDQQRTPPVPRTTVEGYHFICDLTLFLGLMVLVLSRGGFCPKDRRQAEGLVLRAPAHRSAHPPQFAK
jgi:hypothetical protein